jgi:hypothetical protein
VVCEQEVGDAAGCDGEHVGEEDGSVECVDEEWHEREVPEKRDEAVGGVEAEELGEWVVA